MKRSAETAFIQDEVPVGPQPVLPHLQATADAGPGPATISSNTRKTSRRASRGSTILRRGPTSHERDEAERAKAAAAAHWILNNRSSDIPQAPQLPHKRQRSSNALALRPGPPVAGPAQPATLVVPPAVSKAHQRSNVIRRAKPFVDLSLPEDLTAPVPHPAHKRQKTCTTCGCKVDENGDTISTSSRITNDHMANTISFSQSFIEASLNILSRLGLGKWIPNSGAIATPTTTQVEIKAAFPQLAQSDNDIEMYDATANSIQERTPASSPFPAGRVMSRPMPIPYEACPSPSAYTPEQWARFSVHQELARSRYTEQTHLVRISRKVWRDGGYQASANPRCHLVRTMTPSRLSKEILPEKAESSSGLLTSHSSLASTTSATSDTSTISTLSVDPTDQFPVSPVLVEATLQPSEDFQYFPSSNRDYEKMVLSATTSVVESENTRWNFYPLFTGKTPGKERFDTLRKTTLLSNWGHWLHHQNIWDLLWDRQIETVMVWHNHYPAMPLPPPSPFVVALRGDQHKQIVKKAGEDYDDDDIEMWL